MVGCLQLPGAKRPRTAASHATVAFVAVWLCGAVGCQDEAIGRSDTIALHVPRDEALPAGSVALIEDTFGMEVVFRDGGYGAIAVFLFDEGAGGLVGETIAGDYCAATLWSTRDSSVLAHEVGHALGLEHVDAQSNLMFSGDNDGELTEAQIDTARQYAWFHEECRKEQRKW